jgi:hypothetical protein
MASKYDEINALFISCVNRKCTFETLLKACSPYFETVSKNNPDPCEAFSRMSVGLYGLLDVYDESKGKPMSIIRAMCRYRSLDVYRKNKKHSGVTFDTDLVSQVDLSDDVVEYDYSTISQEIDDVVANADYLTKCQAQRINGGSCPFMTETKKARLRNDLLNCKHITEWHDE